MKAVIQRVNEASVKINGETQSSIKTGILVLLGITHSDEQADINWLCNKIINLRIFNDESGVMNKSLLSIKAEAIIVSQFTLMANTKKGNRPSYINAANAETAIPIYENFIKEFELRLGYKVGTGIFGAEMQIDLQNDGPVTIIIDTHQK